MKDSRTRNQPYEMWLPVNIPRPKKTKIILSKPLRRYQPKQLHSRRVVGPPERAKVKKMREVFDKNVQSSFNIPGLEKILQSSSYWNKFIWILAFFAFYGLCTYQLRDRISLYIAAPVTVDITIEKETSVEFPSITVCPPFGISILKYKFCHEEIRKGTLRVMREYAKYSLEDSWDEFKVLEEEIKSEGSCSDSGEKNDSANSASEGKSCSIKLDMDRMEKQPISTFWGKCLRITPPTKLIYRGAWTYVKLKVNHPTDVLNSSSRYCKISQQLQNDTVFIPLEKSVVPSYEVVNQFYMVSKGVEVTVDFRRKKSILLNTKKNPCVDTKSATDCKNKCLERLLIEKISCRLPFMANSSLTPCPFGIFPKLKAVEQIYREFDGCNCRRPCQETTLIYDADYHAAKADMRDEAIFSLTYTDNSVEVITESYTYPFASLLTDIGGNLGFCVGLCLFSFVELILSALQMLRIGIRKVCMCRRRFPVNLPYP